MSNPITRPAIIHPDDLLAYTGDPYLPPERPPESDLSEGERRKGGRRLRKVISGIRKTMLSGRTKTACWRVKISASRKAGREHGEFIYDCPTREEAAYIAAMAHRKLKPWFAQRCLDGEDGIKPARPGDKHYFWNNIWGLWRYCALTTPNGRFIVGAIPGATERKVFITDCNEQIYSRLLQAPLFNRRTVLREKNHEPVQPRVTRVDGPKAIVSWTGLSELVLGEKMDINPGTLSGHDFRRATLLGQDTLPIWPHGEGHPEGWIPTMEPEPFNLITPLTPDWAIHHPYGVVTMNYR